MTREIRGALEQTLNKHGYSFQHRVIAETLRLRDEGASAFGLVSSEVPVRVQEHDTHIDFVLLKESPRQARFIVAECKRVNPKFNCWCFVKSPYPRPPWTGRQGDRG